jgi:2-phospho-L-lactate guanylyltransferase
LTRIALIPIRDFDGMTRLSEILPPDERTGLSRELADRAMSAVADTSMTPTVVTSDALVKAWATGHGVGVVADLGDGLSACVTSAVSDHALSGWLVTHADLPFVTADALSSVSAAASAAGHALAPSVDGGTNVIAGSGPFRFSYGPGSFHRHLAMVPSAAVLTDPALAVEIDTEMHFVSIRNLPLPPSLRP